MSRRFGMSESEQQTNSLAAALRVGTKRAHRIVERVRFIRCFLSGVLDRTTYQHYLRDLHCLYQPWSRS
jgi:heme oxygenase